MRLTGNNLVTAILVIVFAGASHICACLATAALPKAQDASDPHACCRSDDATSPSSAPADDPCKHCSAKASIDQVLPDRSLTAVTASLAIAIWATPTVPTAIDAPSIAVLAVHDTIPPPPILQDLFHSGCLLTI